MKRSASTAGTRSGFTLIELLLVIAIIAIVAGVVIAAVSPRRSITGARDAERKHMEKQLGQALYARLIDEWKLPEATPEGQANAKPICRQNISDAACGGAGGVSLSSLPPVYISAIPVDPVMPEGSKCTGYMVYQEVGRPRVYAANVGKLPGDTPVPASECGVVEGGPTFAGTISYSIGVSNQRSNIEVITIVFDEPTNIQALIDGGQITEAVKIFAIDEYILAASRFQYDSATNTLTIDLSEDGPGGSQYTMLSNGKYQLRFDTSLITKQSDPAVHLEDNNPLVENGILLADFTSAAGDFTGDGVVDLSGDRDLFFTKYGKTSTDPGYEYAFDLNHDGVINNNDYYLWKVNYTLNVNTPPPACVSGPDVSAQVSVSYNFPAFAAGYNMSAATVQNTSGTPIATPICIIWDSVLPTGARVFRNRGTIDHDSVYYDISAYFADGVLDPGESKNVPSFMIHANTPFTFNTVIRSGG